MTAATFAKGSDVNALSAALSPLLRSSSGGGGGGRWTLTDSGEGIERNFKFKTFAKTWDFMTSVSLQCKIQNHHPEWSNVYNTAFIRWTTHNPKGLSAKDISMATLCDAIAKDFGEIADAQQQDPSPTSDAAPSCRLRDLATSATQAAGPECCTPTSKPKSST